MIRVTCWTTYQKRGNIVSKSYFKCFERDDGEAERWALSQVEGPATSAKISKETK